MNLSRTLMNGLQRRQYSEEKIKELFLENGLSDSSADVLLNTFNVNRKFWFDMLVFTNTQDTFFELRALRQENKEILKTLKDLLKILKEGKDPSDSRHFQ